MIGSSKTNSGDARRQNRQSIRIAVDGRAELEDGKNRDRYEKGGVITLAQSACSRLEKHLFPVTYLVRSIWISANVV